MHHKKINDYFLSLINYINDKKYYSNGQVMTYLYGHICHFVLDTTIHPLTIYNTGVYDKKINKLINIIVFTKKWNIILIYI